MWFKCPFIERRVSVVYLTSADLGNASRGRAFIYMSDVWEALTSDQMISSLVCPAGVICVN